MASSVLAGVEGALVLKRTVSASPAEVFEAFTDPGIMQRWMSPDPVSCIAVEADAKPGGRHRIHMRSDQGDHIAVGEYLEVVQDSRLVFSWSWETGTVKNTRVTVTFRGEGDGTEVELLHELLPERDAVEQHTGGWSSCLDNLVSLF